MIIHGFKKKAIKKERVFDTCPDCAKHDSIEITILQKYCRIFWIPTFTYGKTGKSICTVCAAEHELKEFSAPLKLGYENLKSQTKTSPYFYIGTFIVLGFFLLVILSVK